MSRNSSTVCVPDLTSGPFNITVEKEMRASAAALYRAWTKEFDKWFAAPRTVVMKAEVNAPYFFETHYSDEKVKGQRHPHYGRFLKLKRNRIVSMTWVTGAEGTKGAETVVTVKFSPKGKRTLLRLTHEGFYDDKSRKQHEKAWPIVLKHLDETLE